MKTSTLTLHASHNFGSMLQAYALQRVIKNGGFENEIINLRTNFQKQLFCHPLKRRCKTAYDFLLLFNDLFMLPAAIKRYNRFESFLINYLQVSDAEYSSCDELEKKYDFKNTDCLLTGSDQIWNILMGDFERAYLADINSYCLPKRIVAYAPSMGDTILNNDHIEYYQKCLSRYTHLSVRDENAYNNVQKLALNKTCSIDVDPTLLVERDHWINMAGDTPIIKGNYIVIYCPYANMVMYEIALQIGKKLNCKVVNPIQRARSALYNCLHGFPVKHVHSCGPLEFLNLMKFSKLVITGSFHGLLFSLQMHVPFYYVNGTTCCRPKTILEDLNLLHRSITIHDWKKYETGWKEIDWKEIDERIAVLRKKSIESLYMSIVGENENL